MLFYLKVSRPGLWFAALWLYLLPTSQMDIWNAPWFWLGLFYVTFPLNFMVYAWNDIADQAIDRLNPRKDSFWFGAIGTDKQVASLPRVIFITQLLTFPIFVWKAGFWMLLLYAGLLLVNYLYNKMPNGLRSMPPFELLCQFGYLLIVPFSILVNDTEHLAWQTYVYLALFAMQSHLMGEVMDIEPDRLTGRRTTATILGVKKTKLLIILIVGLEIGLLLSVYKAYIFAGMLTIGWLWLLVDLFLIFKTKKYTYAQMRFFAIMSNLVAIVSMLYVWYTACLIKVY